MFCNDKLALSRAFRGHLVLSALLICIGAPLVWPADDKPRDPQDSRDIRAYLGDMHAGGIALDQVHAYMTALAMVDDRMDIIRITLTPELRSHGGLIPQAWWFWREGLSRYGVTLDTQELAALMTDLKADIGMELLVEYYRQRRQQIAQDAEQRSDQGPTTVTVDTSKMREMTYIKRHPDWPIVDFTVVHSAKQQKKIPAILVRRHAQYYNQTKLTSSGTRIWGADRHREMVNHRRVSQLDPYMTGAERAFSQRRRVHDMATYLLVVIECDDDEDPLIRRLRGLVPEHVKIFRQKIVDSSPGLATLAYWHWQAALRSLEVDVIDVPCLPQLVQREHIHYQHAQRIVAGESCNRWRPPVIDDAALVNPVPRLILHGRRIMRKYLRDPQIDLSALEEEHQHRSIPPHLSRFETPRIMSVYSLSDGTDVHVDARYFFRHVDAVWAALTGADTHEWADRYRDDMAWVEQAKALMNMDEAAQVKAHIKDYFSQRQVLIGPPDDGLRYNPTRGMYLLPFSVTREMFHEFIMDTPSANLWSFDRLQMVPVGVD